jgi:hypothetical protein
MATANPAYSFMLTEQNGNYQVNWKAAKLGIGVIVPLLWPALGIGLFMASFATENDPFSLFTFISSLITWGAVFIIVTMFIFNFVLRRGGQFSFTKEGFSMNGNQYPNKDIKGLYIKAPNGEREGVRVYTTVHGFGTHGALHNTGEGIKAIGDSARLAIRASIRKRNYKVCIQYGEREIVLAKHLTEQTAKALLGKIDELI